MPPASTAAPSVGRKDSNQPHAEAAEALAVGAIPEELPAVVRITLGFPRFQGQVGKGHAMTTRLSIDDHPHQDQAPVHGATEGGGRGALPAGGTLLQCRGSAPWASLQQPGPLGATSSP